MSAALYHNMLVSARHGGAEQLALQIHKYVTALRPGTGQLLVPSGGATRELIASAGEDFKTYRLDWLRSHGHARRLLANLELTGKLRRSGRGLLHIHSPYVYGAVQPFLALSGLKTILHLHLDYSEAELQWTIKRPPDLLFVCAAFMRERAAKILGARAHQREPNIVTAINAVDTERFTPVDRAEAKRSRGLEPQRPVFLMAANLAPHKGQITAIRAMATLVREGLRPLLWLVGEEREQQGTYTRQLHELVAQSGLQETVQFLGFRTDVPQLLHAADCLLLPSTHEGLPLSILEAQASNVIVLAAPTAGIPEVVADGRTGFLIAADDAQKYAEVAAAVLRDGALAERVRDTARRQVVANFSLGRYCERILSEYDRLLGAESGDAKVLT